LFKRKEETNVRENKRRSEKEKVKKMLEPKRHEKINYVYLFSRKEKRKKKTA